MAGPPRPHAFELGGVLGRGGMGEVRIAWDPRLGRDVALKTVAPADHAAAARLEREARLTARLEHPGILPVYEAGLGEDGRPWYAMRLFGGRTLADAVAAAPDAAARLALVRHVLAAADALAYAHDQGILHRDLSPRNVLAGPFGETVVADWGLACTLEEAREGGAGGTVGFASPEQAAGAPTDPRADVYGLGALLAAVLTGGTPSLRDAQGLPPELVAIAERALRTDPADRYPDARAFAADLLAWFEGRRVAAHDYTPVELLRRLVVAWRVPLYVAAGGLVAVAAAVGFGWSATAEERERAEASEAEALRARDDEQRAFASALRVQSFLAAEDGRAMETEVLAAHALRRDDGPDARGALAAAFGRPRWTLAASRPAPDCRLSVLSLGGARALCVGEAAVQLLDLDTGAVLARAEGAWARGALVGTGAVLIDGHGRAHTWDLVGPPRFVTGGAVLWGDLPPSALPDVYPVLTTLGEVRVDLGAGTVAASRRCGADGSSRATTLSADGAMWLACNDGRVLRVPEHGALTELAVVSKDDGAPTLLATLEGGRVVVGTASGTVVVFDAAGDVVRRRRLGAGSVTGLATAGERLVVRLSGGEAAVWDLDADVVALRLRGVRDAAWTPSGDLRVLGARLSDRRPPPAAAPHRLTLDAGISALAWSPDGATLAVAAGDGVVTLLDPRTGRRVHRLRLEDAVAKDVAWSPDGRAFVAASAAGANRVFGADGAVLGEAGGIPARRALWLREGGAWLAPYAAELWHLDPARAWAAERVDHRGLEDVEADVTGALAVGLARDGEVWVTEDAPAPAWRLLARVDPCTGVAATADAAWATSEHEVLRIGLDGVVTWRAPIATGPTELAVSADGRWAAVGYVDGAIQVFAVGEAVPRARLAGHRARLSALAFSPDGAWLASGAWDDDVRTWSMAALEASAATSAAEAEAAWGTTLEDVLEAAARGG